MMETAVRDELRADYQVRREGIRRRLEEFRCVKSEDHFYELCYCLLTPQSSAAQCDKVIRELERLEFRNRELDPEPILRSHDGGYVRFHRTKAQRLRLLKSRYHEVVTLISSGLDTRSLRLALARTVKGIGMKEASHFLRNIGRTDVTIIDRHIIRNLIRFGYLADWPAGMTVKQYLRIESLFEAAASELGIPADELDLLLWSRETGFILK